MSENKLSGTWTMVFTDSTWQQENYRMDVLLELKKDSSLVLQYIGINDAIVFNEKIELTDSVYIAGSFNSQYYDMITIGMGIYRTDFLYGEIIFIKKDKKVINELDQYFVLIKR